jgi:hypothetical protein
MKMICKVYWEMCGEVEVEADTVEEAATKAMDAPLPTSAEYVPDSINCDPETDVRAKLG